MFLRMIPQNYLSYLRSFAIRKISSHLGLSSQPPPIAPTRLTPSKIDNLTALRILDLCCNQGTDPIPSEVSQLKGLRLCISHNLLFSQSLVDQY